MYRLQEASASFLYVHLKPNSLTVSSSLKGKCHQSTPQDKDGNWIDTFGRHFYSTGALAIKASNYLACISHFVYGILKDFTPLLPLLPEDSCARAIALQSDGLVSSKPLISSPKHVLELSACTLSKAVALRRFAWLHSTTLPFDMKWRLMANASSTFSYTILIQNS